LIFRDLSRVSIAKVFYRRIAVLSFVAGDMRGLKNSSDYDETRGQELNLVLV